MANKPTTQDVTRFADMLSAMGAEPRLRILRLLLTAHPDGMVVGEIGEELENPQFNAVPPFRQAQERRLGPDSERRHLPALHGQIPPPLEKNCSAFCMPNVVLVTKPLSHRSIVKLSRMNKEL